MQTARQFLGLLRPAWFLENALGDIAPAKAHGVIPAFLARLLGRDVRAEAVARASWDALFRSQGAQNPLPRMQMLDGFNQGWLTFEGQPLTGTVSLETVLLRCLMPGHG
jgi:hypothetical protein